MEEDAGNSLGQDVNSDYSVSYYFKDDDGVIAIVEYKKNFQSDYYESKRSKYEIEKKVYDYAKTVNFNKKFYIYVNSPYELGNNSDLNSTVRNDFILKKRNYDNITFILTEESDENQTFIVSALKNIFVQKNYVKVYEYVVKESEYERAVDFYHSLFQQEGIANHDYDEKFDFNKNKLINYKDYYIK